jgi:hypothetical protein
MYVLKFFYFILLFYSLLSLHSHIDTNFWRRKKIPTKISKASLMLNFPALTNLYSPSTILISLTL